MSRVRERFGDPLPMPANEEMIDDAEREMGVRLPPDVRASYLQHGAESYPAIELLSLEGARREWREWDPSRRRWFPVTNFESDYRCVESGTDSRVLSWFHDEPQPDRVERASFVEWLEWAVSAEGFEVYDD
jgi:hypothetical protein